MSFSSSAFLICRSIRIKPIQLYMELGRSRSIWSGGKRAWARNLHSWLKCWSNISQLDEQMGKVQIGQLMWSAFKVCKHPKHAGVIIGPKMTKLFEKQGKIWLKSAVEWVEIGKSKQTWKNSWNTFHFDEIFFSQKIRISKLDFWCYRRPLAVIFILNYYP